MHTVGIHDVAYYYTNIDNGRSMKYLIEGKNLRGLDSLTSSLYMKKIYLSLSIVGELGSTVYIFQTTEME